MKTKITDKEITTMGTRTPLDLLSWKNHFCRGCGLVL